MQYQERDGDDECHNDDYHSEDECGQYAQSYVIQKQQDGEPGKAGEQVQEESFRKIRPYAWIVPAVVLGIADETYPQYNGEQKEQDGLA